MNGKHFALQKPFGKMDDVKVKMMCDLYTNQFGGQKIVFSRKIRHSPVWNSASVRPEAISLINRVMKSILSICLNSKTFARRSLVPSLERCEVVVTGHHPDASNQKPLILLCLTSCRSTESASTEAVRTRERASKFNDDQIYLRHTA